MLVPGEMHPTTRQPEGETQGTPMESVEHLGQYVFEMAQAKAKAMGGEDVIIEDAAPEPELVDEDEVMLGAGEGEQEDDPLHEHVYNQ